MLGLHIVLVRQYKCTGSTYWARQTELVTLNTIFSAG